MSHQELLTTGLFYTLTVLPDEVPFSYEEFQTYAASWYYFHGVYTSEDYDAALGDAGTQPNGTWTLLTEGAAPTTPTTQSFTLPSTTTAIAFRYRRLC